MSTTRLRITPVVDGVTLPDVYFDHPSFAGAAFSMTIYSEPTSTPGEITKWTQLAGTISSTGGTDASKSPNDSRNPQNYSP